MEASSLEPLDLGVGCTPGVDCPSVAVRSDGVVVSLDPTTGTLSVHDTPEREFTVTGQLDPAARLVFVGPDDVAYIITPTAGQSDPIGDLVAVSTSPGNAGAIVASKEGVVDLSGDSDLVPNAEGIVVVGCCGFEARRPALDAELVLAWVDHAGKPALVSGAEMSVEFRSDNSVDVVRRDGATVLRWNIADVSSFRGMPPLAPTTDGGALAFLTDTFNLDAPSRLVKLGADGSIHEQSIAPYVPAVFEPGGTIIVFTDTGYSRLRPFQ